MHANHHWSEEIPKSFYSDYYEVKKALGKFDCKTVLDLGSGNGSMVNALLNQGFDVFGVDGSQEGVDIGNMNNPGRFFVCDFDCDSIPSEIKDITFDAIVSTQVIEHLYSPKSYIQLCYGILESNGFLVLTTPYHGWLKNVFIALVGQFDHHVDPLKEGGHIKFFSRKTISKLLTENGFRLVSVKGFGRLPFLWKSMIVIATTVDASSKMEG